MSAPDTRITRVRTVARPGRERPSEDRVFVAPSAVIVLDGASQPDPDDRDGGWLADTLGKQLCDRLTESPTADLTSALAQAIEATARQYALTPGHSPSTTVTIVRWDASNIDVLVLGDSPVVAMTRGGRILEVRDDRLSHVAPRERRAFRQAGTAGFGVDRTQEWHALLKAQREHRNQPGGYWIAEAVPEAAVHAVRARWAVNDLAAAMAMTDGVANGVDRYRVPDGWRAAMDLACDGPARLVDVVHDAEDADPDGARWPRSKPHDDKAIALVEFAVRPDLAH